MIVVAERREGKKKILVLFVGTVALRRCFERSGLVAVTLSFVGLLFGTAWVAGSIPSHAVLSLQVWRGNKAA